MLVPLGVSLNYGDQASFAFIESVLLVLLMGLGLWVGTRKSAKKKE